MNAISAVLFDLGNVLVRIHPDRFASTLGLDPRLPRDSLRAAIINLTRTYERGECGTEEFFQRLDEVLDGKFSKKKLQEAMNNVIGNPMAGMEDLLREVLQSRRVALVSNTNEFHFRHCLETFRFLRSIPHHFLSCELHALKPEASYYEQVVERLGIPPSNLLFVDDLRENIEGAEKHGMTTHLFTDADALSRQLRNMGTLD